MRMAMTPPVADKPPASIGINLSDICSVMSQTQTPKAASLGNTVLDGATFYKLNVHNTKYKLTEHSVKQTHGSLVDRGANGGLAGADVRILE